jgi:hypothetical protein
MALTGDQERYGAKVPIFSGSERIWFDWKATMRA